MNRVAWLTCTLLALAYGRIYERCELARELHALGVNSDDISTWVCIAYHESRFDTAANNPYSGDHGIFQISELYWCGHGKACGLQCSALRDDDISNDLKCALQVHEEHTRLQGNGFLAWVVYPQHCKHNTKKYLVDCDITVKNSVPITKSRAFAYEERYITNVNYSTNNGVHNVENLLPPYLALGNIFRGNYGKVLDHSKEKVDWYNYKFNNIDDLKLPSSFNKPPQRIIEPQVTTESTTTPTTTTEYIPPVKPWRIIETNQFRKKHLFDDKTISKPAAEKEYSQTLNHIRQSSRTTTTKPPLSTLTTTPRSQTTTVYTPKVTSTVKMSTSTSTTTAHPTRTTFTARPTQSTTTIRSITKGSEFSTFETSVHRRRSTTLRSLPSTTPTTLSTSTARTTTIPTYNWRTASTAKTRSWENTSPSTTAKTTTRWTTQRPLTTRWSTKLNTVISTTVKPTTARWSTTTPTTVISTTVRPTTTRWSTTTPTTVITTTRPTTSRWFTTKPTFGSTTVKSTTVWWNTRRSSTVGSNIAKSSTTSTSSVYTTPSTTIPTSNQITTNPTVTRKPKTDFSWYTFTSRTASTTAASPTTNLQPLHTTTTRPISYSTTKLREQTTTRKPRTTQSIFDLYLNPTKPPKLPTYTFDSSPQSRYRLKIFASGTTTPVPTKLTTTQKSN